MFNISTGRLLLILSFVLVSVAISMIPGFYANNPKMMMEGLQESATLFTALVAVYCIGYGMMHL